MDLKIKYHAEYIQVNDHIEYQNSPHTTYACFDFVLLLLGIIALNSIRY